MRADYIYSLAVETARQFFTSGAHEVQMINQNDFLNNPTKYVNCVDLYPVLSPLAQIMVDALADMDTKVTKASTLSALKRIVSNGLEGWNGIFEKDGFYCACDGYRLVRLKYDVASLPHIVNNSTTISKMVESAVGDKIPLELPTIAELKAHIKRYPVKNGVKPFLIGGVIPANPKYILDMLNALPDCKAYLPQKLHLPVYFEAESGDGILLPIRADACENSDEIIQRFERLRSAS